MSSLLFSSVGSKALLFLLNQTHVPAHSVFFHPVYFEGVQVFPMATDNLSGRDVEKDGGPMTEELEGSHLKDVSSEQYPKRILRIYSQVIDD